MGLFCETGTFKKTEVVTGDKRTITLANPALEPKLIILTVTHATDLASQDVEAGWSIGASNGAGSEISIGGSAKDNVPTTDSLGVGSNTSSTVLQIVGASNLQAVISAVAPGSFEITWLTNQSVQYQVGWQVWGGDITNVETGVATHTNVATADIDVTFNLTSFRPDAMMFFDPGAVNLPGSVANIFTGMGMAVSASSQAAMAQYSQDNVGTSRSAGMLRTDRCNIQTTFDGGGNPIELRSNEFKNFEDDGWTWIQRVGIAANRKFGWVAIKGGGWDVINGTVRTSPGTKLFPTPFKAGGMLLMSAGHNVGSAYANNFFSTIGMADGANQSSFLTGDKDNVPTSEGGASVTNSACLQLAANMNPGAGPTISSNGVLDSFNLADLRMSWAVGDSSAKQFAALISAESGVAGPGGVLGAKGYLLG